MGLLERTQDLTVQHAIIRCAGPVPPALEAAADYIFAHQMQHGLEEVVVRLIRAN